MRKENIASILARTKAEESKFESSFSCVAQRWHDWWSRGVDGETAAYILRRLEADVFPSFGSMPIENITAAGIRKLILAIEKRGARDVAQRQHGTINQIFRFAVTHDIAKRNPAADFKPSDVLSPRKTQHRAHVEPHQLPLLLVSMERYEGHAVIRHALKLMALTFVWTQELLRAPWVEFDLDHSVWKISAERTKKDRPHVVPLPRNAMIWTRRIPATIATRSGAP